MRALPSVLFTEYVGFENLKPAFASTIVTTSLLGATSRPGKVGLNNRRLNVRSPTTDELLMIGTRNVFVPLPFVKTNVPLTGWYSTPPIAVPSEVATWTDSGTVLEFTITGSMLGFEQTTVTTALPASRRTIIVEFVKLKPASASWMMTTLVLG